MTSAGWGSCKDGGDSLTNVQIVVGNNAWKNVKPETHTAISVNGFNNSKADAQPTPKDAGGNAATAPPQDPVSNVLLHGMKCLAEEAS